jgi:tetratricopeptide (TPR) repeat protein
VSRASRRLVVLLALLVPLALGTVSAPAVAQEGAQTPEDVELQIEDLIVEADALRLDGDHRQAIELYEDAEELAPAGSADARIGLAHAYKDMGAYKNQVEAARSLLELPLDDVMRTYGYTLLGNGLVSMAGTDLDPEPLAEAEDAFRRALEIAGDEAPATFHFNLGHTLLRQGRDEEGVAVLRRMLEMDDTDGLEERARALVDRPERARKRLMPSFSIATIQGDYLTDEDLQGKVVLIDFWGSWCGPCRESTATIARIHRRFTKDDQPFVLLGVNTDSTEQAAQEFMDEYSMVWPQFFDDRRYMTRDRFGVESFPTFLLYSHEGELIYADSGWSDHKGAALYGEVRRAMKKARKDG